jgi:ABC-type oligopeptide transport system substrate-binding subunit
MKRRTHRATTAIAAILLMGLAPRHAVADGPRHGLSAFGDLAYPADFKHFRWVNPDAPKGGRLAMIGTAALTTFDSFNPFILKGDPAQGLGYLFDSLMTPGLDEPDAVYGLVAHSAELAADRSSVTFRMRPEARFSDGSALTAADVVFSFDILKQKGHPLIRSQLRDVARAEALDAHTVRFSFAVAMSRDLPLVVAGLPVLSQAYYARREFDETTLEPPLGSGPYKLDAYKSGTYVSYKRRDDYWGKDLPVNRGRYNFDELRYDYFRDRAAGLLAVQAGEIDLREEFTARDWMTGYDVPAVKAGRLLKLTLPDETPSGAQGFFLNMRRPQLADMRVRKALDYAFDFEFTNKAIFYGLYTRTESFFENSTLKAQGKPSEAELVLLEPFRNRLPPEVFAEPYRPPGLRRVGQGPPAAPGGGQAPEGGRLAERQRQAQQRQGRDAEPGVPDHQRPNLGAHSDGLRREPKEAWAWGQHPPRRPGAIRAPREDLRFRRGHDALHAAFDPRRGDHQLLGQRGRQDRGCPQPGRHQRPRRGRPDRQGDRGQKPRGAGGGDARAGPRAAGRPLLGAAVVQAGPPRRVLGQVRPPGREAPLRSRHHPQLVL